MANLSGTTQKTEDWYDEYYKKQGMDRNNILRNPEVLFGNLAHEASIINAFRSTGLSPERTLLLDVGCGSGGGIITFLNMGFPPKNIHGIEILAERAMYAANMFPTVNIQCGDAASMEYGEHTFDLVYASTMFVQIGDEALAEAIAHQMWRVTKPSGYIVLVDWRYNKPGNAQYTALTRQRISRLFNVGTKCQVADVYHGMLVPPLGRFLSKRIPALYFFVQALLPFLVGQVTTVLRKLPVGD
jgi:ubiquinone/menaquinone biosynthesis C-methylase UbiE